MPILVCLGLTLLGHIPGVIHAIYVIVKYSEEPNVVQVTRTHRQYGTYQPVPQPEFPSEGAPTYSQAAASVPPPPTTIESTLAYDTKAPK
ncbi:hypothetical protein BGZ73_007545 [Actinomortierella ambigua]|nr:hypothetical protein BGZ73_007545 [Actinomortierella ambigua]